MNAKAQSTTLSMPAKPLIISNTLLLTDQSTVNQLSIPTNDVEAVKSTPIAKKSNLPASVSYGGNGFEIRTDDNQFSLAIQNRVQTRFADPFDCDPRSLAVLDRDESSFMIRRARTKLNGHAYVPWLKYYL